MIPQVHEVGQRNDNGEGVIRIELNNRRGRDNFHQANDNENQDLIID